MLVSKGLNPGFAGQAGVKAKHALSLAGKQLAAGIKRKDGALGTISPATSPPPTPHNSNPAPIVKATGSSGNKEPKRGRGKIIGEINSEEMKKNPKVSV